MKSGELVPWFHGSVSREYAEKRLSEPKTAGKYLIRFSEAKPDKFTLVYVTADLKIKNVLISNFGELGYSLKTDPITCPASERFPNIQG